MNFTRTDIVNSTFINGHYLTIFELNYCTITNHRRYIFQDAVYTHKAVLEPNSNTLKYYPEYMPIYNSRAYNEDEYNDCFHEFQAFCDMYRNTPDSTTSIRSKADFGTDVSKTYFYDIAKEVIEVNSDNIKFNEPTSDMPAYVEFDFYICGHKYTACVYINADIDKLSGNITSNIVDGNDGSKHITGIGKFYIGYDEECGCSVGADKSIYIGEYPDMDNGNTLDFMNEHGIPTDNVFLFIHGKALSVFTKYFIHRENEKNG